MVLYGNMISANLLGATTLKGRVSYEMSFTKGVGITEPLRGAQTRFEIFASMSELFWLITEIYKNSNSHM